MADRLRTDLLSWFQAEARSLPWRGSRDPYAVLVSEVMLQQTTVAAVVPYYERWMARFPDVVSLAEASIDDVLGLWQGLGYYRRAVRLHTLAQIVAREGWPQDSASWKELPGIGVYTAGAVCSICFDERVPAVDGNVERVYARVCNDPSTNLGTKARKWAAALVSSSNPGDVNQALMDLGATVCRPTSPNCEMCPIKRHCLAFKAGTQASLPNRPLRKPIVRVQKRYAVFVKQDAVGLVRFKAGEWWEGMLGLPELEESDHARPLGSITFSVTHHRVVAEAHVVEQSPPKGLTWVRFEDLEKAPLPSPHRKLVRMAEASLYSSGTNPVGVTSEPSSAKK